MEKGSETDIGKLREANARLEQTLDDQGRASLDLQHAQQDSKLENDRLRDAYLREQSRADRLEQQNKKLEAEKKDIIEAYNRPWYLRCLCFCCPS